MKKAHRNPMLARISVTSLQKERDAGRSLALLKPEVTEFWWEKIPADEIAKRQAVLTRIRQQSDLFSTKDLVPLRTCPYEFKYRYRDDDGLHIGTCQDWETEQTFFARRRDQASEKAALDWMLKMFGEEYPKRGMALAMGTHRYRADQWLINGVIRLDEEVQAALL